MTSVEKSEMIQKGEQAFSQGNYKQASEFFLRADYKKGIISLGDYLMYKRKLPLLAYGYYKKANAWEKTKDIQRRMIGALSEWIGKDKIRPESQSLLRSSSTENRRSKNPSKLPALDQDGMLPINVNPVLKDAVQRILKKNP